MQELRFLPTIDDARMASQRQRELDIPRHVATELGRSAVDAIEAGVYEGPDGVLVDWRRAVREAVEAKRSIPPEAALPESDARGVPVTEVQVANETTLGAARRLEDEGKLSLALNFANGIHPGGGFLHGARAQEEVLCRSSALYATLVGDPMYEAHRARPLPDSTDWAILSPRVPVFRLDDGTPLTVPWELDVITSAAPYAPTIGMGRSATLLRQRIHRVLAIARAYGYESLVLGAWGCGAFGNDPMQTAMDFREALEGSFDGVFRHVAFAISDWSHERRSLGPFRDVFSD